MPTREINGVSFSFDDRGSGIPLVLLHGFPLDRRMWAEQASDASLRGRLIVIDLPGFGQSQPPVSFTIPSLARGIRELVAQLDALPCVLTGLSMGGYVALNFAHEFQADLRGLILVDTRAEADTAQGKENRQKMIEIVRAKGSSAIAEQMQPKLLSPDTLAHRPHQVRALRQMMETVPAQTIEHALSAMRDRPDMTDALASIAVPTLILVGDADAITPPDVAQSMQKKMPDAELVIVQGAGHMSPLEQPAQVNRAMRNFLARIDKSD
ncbi:MAG TPA: alpha/beta fold hydrolase [Tepidisphaeraceae bacterium]|nr:alpha/beta fold hydrolase [Tepidisphaeraceae bacterium]